MFKILLIRQCFKNDRGLRLNSKSHFFIFRGELAMKRFAGMFLLMLLTTIATAGCYGSGAGCPQGICDEANSPKPPEK